MLSCQFYEIFKNTFFTEYLWVTALNSQMEIYDRGLLRTWKTYKMDTLAKIVILVIKLN